jgi:hypothetical protein
LKINVKKIKILRNRNEQISHIKIGNVDIEEVQRVNYLGAVIERKGGSKADVLTRISKAQQAFNQLGGIWRTNVLSADIKVKMFNCTIKTVLLYAAETWKVDKEITQKLQTFINKLLRNILKIHWPE